MDKKQIDINRINMTLSWISIFALSWLILLKRLPVDGVSVFFFCFFILIALCCWLGAVVDERQNNPNVSKPNIKKGEINK